MPGREVRLPRLQEDGTTARVLSISAEAYPGVLDRLNVSAAMVDGCYVITVAKKPQELHETKSEQEE